MGRFKEYLDRVDSKIKEAIHENHSPEETAFSAAFGTFVCLLPTFGFGIIFFLILFKFVKSLNKLAVFVPVVIFNPAVQYPLYVLSYNIGRLIVASPPPEETFELALRTRALRAITTFLAGNLIIAILGTLIVYFMVLKAARFAKKKDIDPLEEIID